MSKKKILIVEDEVDLANIIKNYLKKEQYDVEIISNGKNAIYTIHNYKPDLIVLDLMLPEKDGLEILRDIRTNSVVPVIITSAKSTELDKILGLRIGADDYMTKPFSIKELVARIETIFRRIHHYQFKTNGRNNQNIQFEDILINQAAREVCKNDKIINLTSKEYDTLLFLASHPKQVLSKEQIYDNVWGMDSFGDVNTVTIHIQKIREKLGKTECITTVRGIGYRFYNGIII